MAIESFSPTVKVDGRTVTPFGWMWVLGFALGGCEWAIREADTEEFRARVLKSLKDEKMQHMEEEIKICERRIAKLRQELRMR